MHVELLSDNKRIVKTFEYYSKDEQLNIHVHFLDISLPKGYNQAKTYKQDVGISREGTLEVLFFNVAFEQIITILQTTSALYLIQL